MTTEVIKKWAKKVMGQLNLSEEGKLINFGDYAMSMYQKGIKEREKAIKAIEEERSEFLERAGEISEELAEDVLAASLNVDISSINSRSERESYFKVFDAAMSRAISAVDKHEEHSASKVSEYDKKIEEIKGQIAILKSKTAVLELSSK